jgi:16S rRNA (guanine527-N7)-methyltransferase
MEIGSAEWKSVIIDGAAELGVEVSEEQAALFAVHAREMVRWNRRINLTAVTDPFEMAIKHYVDCIAAIPLINPGASLLDAGSGAGFPGIPLKIMRPSLNVTLMEARRKRVSFLKHILRTLGLVDVGVLHARLEETAASLPPGNGFDIIVSRAFSHLESFAAHAMPLLNPGGCLVAFKGTQGDKLSRELAGLEHTGVESAAGRQIPKESRLHVDIKSIRLPRLETERTFIIISLHESRWLVQDSGVS